MEVILKREYKECPAAGVVLRDPIVRRTACKWVHHCPTSGGHTVDCEECPAFKKPGLLTAEESIEWWKHVYVRT